MDSLQFNSQSAFDFPIVFAKYDTSQKGYLTKTEFKCAFIFVTGLKPSKQDMQVVRQFIQQQSQTLDLS